MVMGSPPKRTADTARRSTKLARPRGGLMSEIAPSRFSSAMRKPATSPGVRLSLTGTPSSRTGRRAPGWSSSTTISRAREVGLERLVELEHGLQAAVVLGGEGAPLLAARARGVLPQPPGARRCPAAPREQFAR